MVQHTQRFGHLYWDHVLAETRRGAPVDVWRAYMRQVYTRLMQDWLPAVNAGRGLKTDLFEEAVSHHHLLSDLGLGSVGLDCSLAIVQAARKRLTVEDKHCLLLVGDVRRIPLRSGATERILVGSSLDHFPHKADIAVSLAEVARALAPGGTLVVTFDNPENPMVWLRNHLPFSWLNRLRLVPYYVGRTYNRKEAHRQLEILGLVVTDVTAVAHAPRTPAIWLVMLAERLRWTCVGALLIRLLCACERFERLPTRYLTGYFVAIRAVKPST